MFKEEGESPATRSRAVLFQVGLGRYRRGLQVDRARDLPRGTPQPHVDSLSGKGEESRGRAQRCLSCSRLVTRVSAIPRAAGPGAVRPRAVGLLLLHLPRLQHALLRCWREVGESCGMEAIPCPAESRPPCALHVRSPPWQARPEPPSLLSPSGSAWRSWDQSPRALNPTGEMLLLCSHPRDAPSLSPCPCPAGAAVEHAVLHPHPKAGGTPEQRGVV